MKIEKITHFILVFGVYLLIIGCSNSIEDGNFSTNIENTKSNKGAIVLNINKKFDTRTIVYDFNYIDSYDIIVTSNNGFSTINSSLTPPDTNITINDLEAGSWNITVNAKKSGNIIGTGTKTNINVALNSSVNVSIPIVFLQNGTGNMSLKISFPVSTGIDYVSGLINGTTLTTDLSTDGIFNSAIFTKSNLTGGIHNLEITFKRGGSSGTIAGIFRESINIWNDVTSDKWIDSNGQIVDKRIFLADEFSSLNSKLSNIVINNNNLIFNSDTFDYSIKSTNLSAIIFSATKSIDGQYIQYQVNNGIWTEIKSGIESIALDLSTAPNLLKIKVIAPDKVTEKSYSLTFIKSYSISIGGLLGGTITVDNTIDIQGSTINLTVTPYFGYSLKSGTLKYNDGTDHLITGTSFTMPAANVTVSAEFEGLGVILEDFEKISIPSEWIKFTSNASYPPVLDSTVSHSSIKSIRMDSKNLWSGESVSITRIVNLSESFNLRFWYKTDIGGSSVETYLKLIIDNVTVDQFSGYNKDKDWKVYDKLIPSGNHTICLKLEKYSNSYNPETTNSIWIDDISFCSDVADSITISPKGKQLSVINTSLVKYQANILRKDLSIKSDVTATLYVIAGTGNGSLDSNGLFTGSSTGICTIRASYSAFTADSGIMEILPADYMQKPFTYRGSLYNGKTTTGTGNPKVGSNTDVTITYPTTANFDADGFFALEGNVNVPENYNYIWVKVFKGTDETHYYLRNNFSERIWLRFGSGSYTIEVYRLISMNVDLSGEGFVYGGGTDVSLEYTFTVNNTRDESGIWIYPSNPVQADDIRIQNLANSLIADLTSDYDKIKSIHDYIVNDIYYDWDSYTGESRKMDAISVFLNGTGVCEGYANYFSAVSRAAGFTTKFISSSAMNHAWNNIFHNGQWYFIDCTWDDPLEDPFTTNSPDNLRYMYFLLTDLDGVDGDHDYSDIEFNPHRSIMSSDLPRMPGWPNGYY